MLNLTNDQDRCLEQMKLERGDLIGGKNLEQREIIHQLVLDMDVSYTLVLV